jgi:hypothetical protein
MSKAAPMAQVFQRDDGLFEVGLADPLGPFETRQFAEAVIFQNTNLPQSSFPGAQTGVAPGLPSGRRLFSPSNEISPTSRQAHRAGISGRINL